MKRNQYVYVAESLLTDLDLEEVSVDRVESITLGVNEYSVTYMTSREPFEVRTITRRIEP